MVTPAAALRERRSFARAARRAALGERRAAGAAARAARAERTAAARAADRERLAAEEAERAVSERVVLTSASDLRDRFASAEPRGV